MKKLNVYKTELDGMGTVATKEVVLDGEYLFVQDSIYDDDVTLFKNKHTKNDKLDLKLVKLADYEVVKDEDLEKHKPNKLYKLKGVYLTSANRLNKNQLMKFQGSYYVIKEIKKTKGEPMGIEVEKLVYKTALNVYTILSLKDSKVKIHKQYTSYREAINAIAKLREKANEEGGSVYYRLL